EAAPGRWTGRVPELPAHSRIEGPSRPLAVILGERRRWRDEGRHRRLSQSSMERSHGLAIRSPPATLVAPLPAVGLAPPPGATALRLRPIPGAARAGHDGELHGRFGAGPHAGAALWPGHSTDGDTRAAPVRARPLAQRHHLSARSAQPRRAAHFSDPL